MCGIAGILNFQKPLDNAAPLKRMCDIIAHRGPDDAGYYFYSGSRFFCFDEAFREKHYTSLLPSLNSEDSRDWFRKNPWKVALGHRRLSILDLTSAGHQPMASPDAKCWITYNGEVYNFPELRRELEAEGGRFRSQTDTEVLLALYQRDGMDFVKRLNGMFAFAIWDEERKTLFAARDRYGVKPLYYYLSAESFIFCSEIKGILASGLVPSRLDLDALNQYLTFQNIYDHKTLFENIFLLEPGHVLELNLRETPAFEIKRYWDFQFTPSDGEGKDFSGELLNALSGAVRRQLRSDVPVGSYLSGGIDSSAIVAFASQKIKHLLTFTTGFDMSAVTGIEQGFDERAEAVQTASRFGTEHYESVLHSGDMQECLPQLVWHLEDLRVGTCYQNFYAAKLASRFVKVCLAGTGGDEIFAGYPWRYQTALNASGLSAFDESYYGYWQRLLPDKARSDFFEPAIWERAARNNPRTYFDRVMARAPKDFLNRALYFEAKTFLSGLLIVEDKISMAHSMEVRVPFLDNELVDLALHMPDACKLSSAGTGKRILRDSLHHVLPKETLWRKKQGFSAPDGNWYRGPSIDYIKQVLLDPSALSRGLFRKEAVETVLREHTEGKANHRLLIWSLLCLEWLQRHFMDRPVTHFQAPVKSRERLS